MLFCPSCKAGLEIGPAPASLQAVSCPGCRLMLEVETYPALWRTPQAGRRGELVTGDEAGCFVHADRRAEAACDACGRFMCALCEVRVGEKQLCVACLEDGRRGGRLVQVEHARTVFAVAAVRLTLFSILLGPFAPLAGLAAITLAVLGLARPTSVTGRRHTGSAIAAIVLTLAISGPWTFWWLSMFLG